MGPISVPEEAVESKEALAGAEKEDCFIPEMNNSNLGGWSFRGNLQ